MNIIPMDIKLLSYVYKLSDYGSSKMGRRLTYNRRIIDYICTYAKDLCPIKQTSSKHLLKENYNFDIC